MAEFIDGFLQVWLSLTTTSRDSGELVGIITVVGVMLLTPLLIVAAIKTTLRRFNG